MDQFEKREHTDTEIKNEFGTKWTVAGAPSSKNTSTFKEESSVFVQPGSIPHTQRQFSLFWYSDFIRQTLLKKQCRKVLEVGCGRGTVSLYLRIYDGMETTLVDFAPSAIDLAKKNFSDNQAQGEFVVADAKALPFTAQTFDAVISIGLLEHFPDYEVLLAEMYRVLKSEGLVVSLNIPKKHSTQDVNLVWRQIYHAISKIPLKKDYYRNADTPQQFEAAAKQVEFVNTYYVFTNPFPLFAPAPVWFDRFVTKINNLLMGLRKRYKKNHPMISGQYLSQSHFLVGEKILSVDKNI